MNCQLCGKVVQGDISVTSEDTAGCVFIRMESSPDRDWIACDGCNTLVCHDCCQHPESGYCDTCIASYGLWKYLVEGGLIAPERDDWQAEAERNYQRDIGASLRRSR